MWRQAWEVPQGVRGGPDQHVCGAVRRRALGIVVRSRPEVVRVVIQTSKGDETDLVECAPETVTVCGSSSASQWPQRLSGKLTLDQLRVLDDWETQLATDELSFGDRMPRD